MIGLNVVLVVDPDPPRWEALRRHGFDAVITCPSVPFQLEGTVEGAWWYFRARSSHWQLGVSRTSLDDAIERTLPRADGPGARAGTFVCVELPYCGPDYCLCHGIDDDDDRWAAMVAAALRDCLTDLIRRGNP